MAEESSAASQMLADEVEALLGLLQRFGMEQSLCAAPVAELLASVSQAGLSQERLYELARASFHAIAHAEPSHAPAHAAAALLKISAVAGVRPTFDSCVLCGSPIGSDADVVPFSAGEGGALCASCPRPHDAIMHDKALMAWGHALLYARFDDIPGIIGTGEMPAAVLSLAGSWVQHHFGTRLKSLDVLLSCSMPL